MRESLEKMGKKELIKARAGAIKDLVEVVLGDPLAQEVPQKSAYSKFPPKEVPVPESDVIIKATAIDQGDYAFRPRYMVTMTHQAPEYNLHEVKELDSYDKPLDEDHSLRDMEAVVEDIVTMRTMQEQLSAGQALQSQTQ